MHTTASLHARNGGPPRTISALAQELGQRHAEVEVLALADGDLTEAVLPDPEVASTRFVEPGASRVRRYRQAVEASQADLVHDHGMWLPTNHASARGAARLGVPLVVSARGMLEPWARQHGRWKKTAAWWAFQRRDLASAAVLHATAESEAESMRAAGLRAPIAVIPNGVSTPPPGLPRETGSLRRALFLSRIHPKKGLPMLLDAWSVVRPAGWELVIAGPDEADHRSALVAQSTRLGLNEVRFLDSVDDKQKWDLYRSADLFVLPTYSENFGVVVAEALAAGVPVLTTTGAPWADLRDHRCGWWVKPTTSNITEALRMATAATAAERTAMGERGRELVAQAYGWPGIAERMAEVYAWALGRRASLPSDVHVD